MLCNHSFCKPLKKPRLRKGLLSSSGVSLLVASSFSIFAHVHRLLASHMPSMPLASCGWILKMEGGNPSLLLSLPGSLSLIMAYVCIPHPMNKPYHFLKSCRCLTLKRFLSNRQEPRKYIFGLKKRPQQFHHELELNVIECSASV